MSTVLRGLNDFLFSEDGPTAVEYAVMMALIIVVCIGTISNIGQNADSQFQSVNATLSTP